MVFLAFGQLLFPPPCPSLHPFHLCTPRLLFLPHAPILLISNTFSIHPGLLYSIQSCNNRHCHSTILSRLFSPGSLLLYLPKGCPGSVNPLFSPFAFPRLHGCSTSPSFTVFFSSERILCNHSVSTLLTYPPPPQSLSAWSTLGESKFLLNTILSPHHFHHHSV